MARIKRKQIEFNDQALKDLMQETYNDAHQIRSTIIALFNGWNGKIKEAGEIAAFGKEVVNLINAMARNQDQKINLLKILNDIITDRKEGSEGGKNGKKKDDGENETLNDDAKQTIRNLIADMREKGEVSLD